MSCKREVVDLLKREGFHFVKHQTHEIWSDGSVTLRISCTPGDYRYLAAVRSMIRSKRRKILERD